MNVSEGCGFPARETGSNAGVRSSMTATPWMNYVRADGSEPFVLKRTFFLIILR